jgi:phosphoglycerate dehydrogenase-like enzyme
MRVAVLDDWQGVAQSAVDWSALQARAEVVFFEQAFADEDEAAQKLADFDILMAMRERTPFPASLIARLPKLKYFAMTGRRAATIDFDALARHGVTIAYADADSGTATAELALGLMLAAARGLPQGDAAIRAGGFQAGVPHGFQLAGKTLGIIGLGKIGSRLARYAAALDMHVLAWSQNLTPEKAREGGAEWAEKPALLASSDVVSLHLVLSDRSRGIIGAAELAQMKRGAILINTSRAPLIEPAALQEAVAARHIVAALDVYPHEPLPADAPWRTLPNSVLSPHLGYCTVEVFQAFYAQGIASILAYLA